MPRRRSTRPLLVLEAVKAPDGTTRYIDQVVTFADDDVRFFYISPRRFLFANYHVVHVHWPEMILRHRSRVIEGVKCLLFDAWLRRLERRRIAVVRTLHNVVPHEAVRPAVKRSMARLDSATDLFVAINPTTAFPDDGLYIPHGHYRDRFERHKRVAPVIGRVLYAGLIRPYKGVEELIDAFRSVPDGTATLRIVGKPTEDLGGTVRRAVAAAPGRVSACLAFVPDEQLVAEVTQSELVCLPYRDLHNSGMLLVALSLDRPVLVPDTPSTRALAEEVGPGWVLTFSGQLRGAEIQDALERLRTTPRATRPTLSERDWQRVGRLYSESFKATAARVRAR